MNPNCISHFKCDDLLQFEQEGVNELHRAVDNLDRILNVMRTSQAPRSTWNAVMQEEVDNLIKTAMNYKEQFANKEKEAE